MILLAFPFVSCAQTNACLEKTYAFSRAVIGGVAPTDVVEVGGKVIKGDERSNKQYFIYLQTCPVDVLTITSVYINGNAYSATAQKTKTPVTVTNTSNSTKNSSETLVEKTSRNVWELVLEADDTKLKPAATLKKMIDSNAVVVTGILKGKNFTTLLKSLKELEPMTAQ